MERVVLGVLPSYELARSAIAEMEQAGVAARAISVLAREPHDARRLAEDTGTDAALESAVTNDRVADFLGWLTGIGAAVVPAVGPDVATGTLGATLPAAQAGTGRGSVTGALVGLGLPVDLAAECEANVADGDIVVVVSDQAHEDRAREILARYGRTLGAV